MPSAFWSTPNEHCAGLGPRPSNNRPRGRSRRRRCGEAARALARAVDDLADLVAATRQIAAQTRQRLAGVTPNGATRRVSLHDPNARPIGRLGKPVEFGHKAQLADNEDGVVLDYTVEQGSTTPSNKAARPTPRNLPRRSNGSPDAPADHRVRSPPTAATANRRSTTAFANSASARS